MCVCIHIHIYECVSVFLSLSILESVSVFFVNNLYVKPYSLDDYSLTENLEISISLLDLFPE